MPANGIFLRPKLYLWTKVLALVFAGAQALALVWFGILCEWPDPLGMFMHSLPWLPVLAAAALGWFRPRAGGILLLVLAAAGILFFHTYRSLAGFMLVSFPLLAGGLLFLLSLLISGRNRINIG